MRVFVATIVVSLLLSSPASAACIGFGMPVDGPIIASFAPTGRYSGHWGVDIATEVGSDVGASEPGVVTFSGSVAGNQTISIDHGGGVKTSYSYLSERLVSRGTRVSTNTVIGRSGVAHDVEALHFSVRVDGVYRNPVEFVGCLDLVPADGLRLVG